MPTVRASHIPLKQESAIENTLPTDLNLTFRGRYFV
jgi:hypothetical protein